MSSNILKNLDRIVQIAGENGELIASDSGALKVSVEGGTAGHVIIDNAELAVEISASDGDNIAIVRPDGSNPLLPNADGSLNVNISAASVTVTNAAGASAVNVQDGGNSLTVDGTVGISGSVAVTGPLTDAQLRATAVPISAASLPLPSGAATESTVSTLLLDNTFKARINALGQKGMAASTPVVIASDQSAVPASQSGTWNINNINGAISLPTGAATQATLATLLLDSTFTSMFPSFGQKAMEASLPIAIASDQSSIPVTQSGTWNLTNISGTVSLPTGAATAANQATMVTSLSNIDAGTPAALGQTTMSASMPVTIASNQTSLATTAASANRQDTYTGTANGTTINASTAPLKAFSLQVKGTGAAATSWDVRLEGSLDNANFTQVLQHTNVDGDGAVKFSGASLSPALYFRSRCAGLTLGSATNIVVTILGVE